ncbi:ABC transporter permease [soil metagenome]
MFKATLKDLLGRKLRLVTTSLAVLLGVAFLAGTLVLTDTLCATFDDLFADIYEGTDSHVRSEDAFETDFGETRRAPLDAALLDTVTTVDGVASAAGFVEGYAQLVDADGEPLGGGDFGAPTFGFNWIDDPDLNPFRIEAGEPPTGPGQVALDAGSADESGFGVGDQVTVLTAAGPVEAEVTGVANFGGTVDSPGGASVMLFDTATAQELFAQPGTFGSIDVTAAEGLSEDELATRIAAALPDGVEVLTGVEITAEEQSEIGEALVFIDTFLLVFAVVALLVGAFIIYNTFSIIVAQRSRDLALLRALGASRRQVMASVLGEALVVGLLASGLGLLAGIGVASGLKSLLSGFGIDLPATGLVVAPATVVISILVGVIVSIGSAVFPARRASRISPMAAMRDVAVDTSGRSGRRVVIGLVITALGSASIAAGLIGGDPIPVGLGAVLVFVGVAVLGPVIAVPVTRVLGAPLPRLRGVACTLARENALRNPNRTSATAAALMIGVGLIGFITVFASSTKTSVESLIGENFIGDLVVDSGSSFGGGGFVPAVADRLAELPEVAAAGGIRFLPAVVNGEEGTAEAVDPAIAEIFELDVVAGSFADLGPTGIALLDSVAADEGLGLGDTVPVSFPRTGEQAFTVGAIYANDDFAGDYALSTEAAALADPAALDFQVYVSLADGVSLDEARPAVEAVTADYANAEVLDRAGFVASQTEEVDQVLNLVYVLLMLAVIIALLGIANTLALSIFERTRELGLLRAVGMTRSQLRSAVRWESVIIALLGTLLGLAVGLGFSRALVAALGDEGITIYDVPVTQLLVIAVIGALAGVAAAILPARRAARLDVLAAIASE